MSRRVDLFMDRSGEAVRVGEAIFAESRTGVSTMFSYDEEYLRSPGGYAVDPQLPLYPGAHPVEGLPGAFQDSAPDRWGRNLIYKGHQEAGAVRTLTEVDYLLGVSDETRQGNLRFRMDGGFLAPHSEVPKMVSLPKLQSAADRAAEGEDFSAVKELLDAGTGSLGGARPKASVRDDAGRLAIAKFTHPGDQWNVIRWEKTALDLAGRAGIETPEARLTSAGGRPVLVLDRFDRAGASRIGYVSAMTLTEMSDGEAGDYLNLVEAIDEHVEDPRAAPELFRRIAFSSAIHNTDDHMRNHGFVRRGREWSLSPVFDVNPNPDVRKKRVTAITGAASADEEAEALPELAEVIGLRFEEARRILAEVAEGVSEWRSAARANGVPESEVRDFAEVIDSQRERLLRVSRTANGPGRALGDSGSGQPRRSDGTFGRKK